MRIETIFIGLIIFGVIIVTGFLVFEEQIVFNNLTADNSKLSGMRDQMDLNKDSSANTETRNKVQGDLDTDAATAEDAMFKGGFSAIKDIVPLTARVGNISTTIVQESGIFPAYMMNALSLIIAVLGTAFLIYMVMRFKPQ